MYKFNKSVKHSENYEMLNERRSSLIENIPSLRIGRLNIVKVIRLCKLTYRFNTVNVRISANFFVETDILILKFIWNCRVFRRANTVLKRIK